MTTPTVQGMRAFRAVAELGSFKRAAERLALSSSAVSKLVAGLEQDVGAQLLRRTTRTLSLTEAGATFLELVVRVLDELERAVERLHERDGQPRGTLRVSAPTSFALRWLSPRIPQFLARHPAVRLDLSLDDRLVDVVADGYDCTLRIGSSLPDSSLHARRLGAVRRVLVAAPRYLKRAPPLRAPADLAAHEALVYTRSNGDAWPFVVGGRRVDVTVAGRYRVDNSVMLRDALLAGIGLTLTPRFVVDDLLTANRLVALLPDCMPPPHGVFGVTAQRRHAPLKTRAFLDFVAEQLRASEPAEEPPGSAG